MECAQGEFSCPQITDGSPGQCHPVDNLCDLIIDCLGGWDEAESTCGNCPKHLVHCKVEGKDSCIQSFQVCDDQVDCDGNWDEEINLCPCRGLEILCPSGICVGIQQSLCNGRENECGELDNFDEELCGKLRWSKSYFRNQSCENYVSNVLLASNGVIQRLLHAYLSPFKTQMAMHLCR